MRLSKSLAGACVAYATVATLSLAAFLPLCDFVHACGCTFPYLGGASRCNVNAASGPVCPWCEHSALGAIAGIGALGLQGLAFGIVWRRSRSALQSAAAAAVGFVLAVVLVAGLLWLPTDYPHWIVENARSRLGVPPGPIVCHR